MEIGNLIYLKSDSAVENLVFICLTPDWCLEFRCLESFNLKGTAIRSGDLKFCFLSLLNCYPLLKLINLTDYVYVFD